MSKKKKRCARNECFSNGMFTTTDEHCQRPTCNAKATIQNNLHQEHFCLNFFFFRIYISHLLTFICYFSSLTSKTEWNKKNVSFFSRCCFLPYSTVYAFHRIIFNLQINALDREALTSHFCIYIRNCRCGSQSCSHLIFFLFALSIYNLFYFIYFCVFFQFIIYSLLYHNFSFVRSKFRYELEWKTLNFMLTRHQQWLLAKLLIKKRKSSSEMAKTKNSG